MTTTEKRRAKSPYQRYNKRPYKYSEAHQAWKHAAINRDEHGMRRHGDAQMRLSGMAAFVSARRY